jgi:hypothetical protein
MGSFNHSIGLRMESSWVVREDQREEVNLEPLSEVRVGECQNGKFMWKGKLLCMRMRKWRKGEWL